MSYEAVLAVSFKRDFKRLAKKYRSLNGELDSLISSLEENPIQGNSLGRSCYKIRLAIKSKGTGKSGEARVVTYVVTEDEQVILLTIYDKKDKADLDSGELDALLSDISE